jgi:hypothetical protein
MMTRTLCLLAIVLLALPIKAEVVQLVRPGETVLTLQPGSTRALVRETRALQLPAGESAVSFSWIGANVDWSSVALSLEQGAVGEVSRAPGQDKTLVWQVSMPQAGTTAAVVSYFLEGVKWQPAYVLTFSPAEGQALLESSIRLTNDTGTALRQVCLQIGAPGMALADQPERPASPAQCLSAMVSIEPGATVVVPFATIPGIPAAMRYVYQAERSGTVAQILRLGLDQVGVTATELPDGPMLIQHVDNPQIPLFNTQLDFEPGKEFEVAMGPEPELVVERKLVSSKRSNFDFDRFGRITGLDTAEEVLITAHNHLACAVTLEVIETILSTWDLKGPETAKRETSWVQWDMPAAAGAVAELRFSLVKHAGTRVKK